MEENNEYRITMENISKTFPGVKALDNVSLKVKAGEVHGLVGENGAGKSTLIKILMGAHKKDPGSGDIKIEGKKVNINNPLQAIEHGMAAVYQHMKIAPELTVAENIFLGRQPRNNGIINWKKMNEMAREVLEEVNMENIDPRVELRSLSNVNKRMVAIAKALSQDVNIIIFDEPTAQLAEEETEELHRHIKDLKDKDISIIYISHRLDEVFNICDRVSVLRDGKLVMTDRVENLTENDLITHMVGREVGDLYYKEEIEFGDVVLEVEDLEVESKIENVSFQLREGEVLGVFGLVGAGRTEMVKSLFGVHSADSGLIKINGKEVKINSPLQAIKSGMAFIPEDRHTEGVALTQDIVDNSNLVRSLLQANYGLLNAREEQKIAEENVEDLDIRTPSIFQKLRYLSGGNQQKVVVAKWINANSKIILMDEPTVGIDVGAKKEIYKLMAELLKQGKAIIFISSYIPELLGICDKIMTLSEGRMTSVMKTSEATQEELLYYATR